MAISDPSLPLSPEAVQKLKHYVKERQKAEGGFGLTPGLPATVEDTFYAVGILELLGQEPGGLDQTRAYLEHLSGDLSGPRKIFYQYLELRRKFALPPLPGMPWAPRPPRYLEEAFYAKQISSLLGKEPGGGSPAPGLPAGHTVKDLYYFLGLRDGTLTQKEKSHWLKWVQACQTPAGGFGFKPGTTAFMDNVLPALEILRQLGGAPLNFQGTLAFILACQTKSGAFARASDGVAILESSYQAVKSLLILGEMKSPPCGR